MPARIAPGMITGTQEPLAMNRRKPGETTAVEAATTRNLPRPRKVRRLDGRGIKARMCHDAPAALERGRGTGT